jgi:Na+/H+-dicarboxylate symporter
MKTNFAFWIFIGIAAGTALGLIVSNIVAGVSCSCAIGNLPVLFSKRKIRAHTRVK